MYETLSQIDVSSKIETIGNNRSYLSWSFALDALLQACPDAEIRWAKWPLVIFTNSGPEVLEDVRVPYCVTPEGYLVECSVSLPRDEETPVTRSCSLFVMDFNNNAILPKPYGSGADLFAINKALLRALVKAIAMHGLALNVYASEDLPLGNGTEGNGKSKSGKSAAKTNWKLEDALELLENAGSVKELSRLLNTYSQVWKTQLNSKDQLKLQNRRLQLVEELQAGEAVA